MKTKLEMKTRSQLKTLTAKSIAPLKKMSVSDWADTYRIISQGSAEPGKWRTSRIPYAKDIMDAFTQPDVHRVVVKSSSQIGKALDIETPIPTPEGFIPMRDINVGSQVFDECGNICNVVAATDIMYNRPCYEITFSDGSKIVADADHRWIADGKLLTTTQLREGMTLPEIILSDKLRNSLG